MNQGIEIMLHTFNVMIKIKKNKNGKLRFDFTGTCLNLQGFVVSLIFPWQSTWVDNIGKGRRQG